LAENIKELKRLGCLDSIRGIAAAVVVLHHCWGMSMVASRESYHGLTTAFLSFHNLLFYILEKCLDTGRSAVMLFFVLSGFVLACSLQKQPMPYAGYAAKRMFRIYPAFAFVVLYSYSLHCIISVHGDVNSGWIKGLFSIPNLSPYVLAKHLLMFGNWRNDQLDPAMWSLVHEMRISLIFPFILLLVNRYRWHGILACLLTSIACTAWTLYTTNVVATGIDDVKVLQTFLSTGYFIVFFACGAFLAIERERITRRVAGMTAWKKSLLFAFCAGCFLKTDMNNHTLAGAFVDYMRGAGALVLIALALGVSAFAGALNHKTLLWLGRISYSLYLIHFPLIYAVNQAIGASSSVIAVSSVVIILSLLAAEFINRAIEVPLIKLGKKLCAPIPVTGLHQAAMSYTNLAGGFTDNMAETAR
jgi:peptidoglycan/LPS O-acetylase OafA/YrhL